MRSPRNVQSSVDNLSSPMSSEGGIEALAGAVHRWLSDPASARQAARAAGHTASELGGAINRTLHAIEPLLMRVALGQRESAP